MYSQNDDFQIPPSHPAAEKKWYQRWWGIAILVFLAVLLSLTCAVGFYIRQVVILLQSGQITAEQLFNAGNGAAAAPVLPNWATTDDPSLGPQDAKVVIVEFADFQCPACKQVQPVVKQLLKDYGDKVLFVFRDFPLLNDHPQAAIAALAAGCAYEQGRFWEMQEWLFANAGGLSELNLKTYAVSLGLDTMQFGSCLQTAKYAAEIEADYNDGIAAGVKATPTFFINGYKMEGAGRLVDFEKAITALLSQP